MEKSIIRTCMGCNNKTDKNELIRVVKDKNAIKIDTTGNADGRGAYICKNEECLNKVIKTKKMERILKKEISEEIYNNLRGVIIDKK